jgi:hypothetical protein
MSIEELEGKLSSVDEEYSHDDAYHFFEILGFKLNILINNNWIGYIEDVTVIITIPKVDGIVIADRICKEVKHKSEYDSLLGMNIPMYSNMTVGAFEPAYPSVEYLEENTVVTVHRREIPHKRPINLFGKPLRIFIGNQAIGSSIVLEIKIYGKNIPTPIDKRLKINVIRPEPPISTSNQHRSEELTDKD